MLGDFNRWGQWLLKQRSVRVTRGRAAVLYVEARSPARVSTVVVARPGVPRSVACASKNHDRPLLLSADVSPGGHDVNGVIVVRRRASSIPTKLAI